MYPNGYLGLSIGHKNGLFVTIGPPDNDVDLKTKPPPERPGGGVLMLDVIPLGTILDRLFFSSMSSVLLEKN